MENKRMNNLQKMIPAERAIYDAMLLVEDLGADEILTKVSDHLQKARLALAVYVDKSDLVI